MIVTIVMLNGIVQLSNVNTNSNHKGIPTEPPPLFHTTYAIRKIPTFVVDGLYGGGLGSVNVNEPAVPFLPAPAKYLPPILPAAQHHHLNSRF